MLVNAFGQYALILVIFIYQSEKKNEWVNVDLMRPKHFRSWAVAKDVTFVAEYLGDKSRYCGCSAQATADHLFHQRNT